MNNIKKIILILLINGLLITMGIYYYKYMVIEYKKFIEKNKVFINVLGLEEANVVKFGDGAEAVNNSIVVGLRNTLDQARELSSSD